MPISFSKSAERASAVGHIVCSSPGQIQKTSQFFSSLRGHSAVWIISPAIDLFFICGGAVLLLATLHSLALAHAQMHAHQLALLTDLSILAALFLGETHTAATIVALLHDRNWRKRHALLSEVALVLAICAVLAITSVPGMAPYAVRLYLLSVSWHFCSQCRGIIIMYCRRAGYSLSRWQDALINGVCATSMLGWMFVQLSNYYSTGKETFLLQALPPLPILPVHWVVIVSSLSFLLLGLFCLDLALGFDARRPVPPLPAVCLLFCMASIFSPVAPFSAAQGSIWLFAPALFHGSQYLCVLARRFLDSSGSQSQVARLYCKTLFLAAVLFGAGPALLYVCLRSCGITYGAALAAVFIGVQIYHMAMDSAIWRRQARRAS